MKRQPVTIIQTRIEQKIFIIRGKKVMLDRDLAELYEVPTKVLNQAVRRNLQRFPEDFMFKLTWKEATVSSRSQFVTLKGKNIKYRPFAFTEHGILMLSSVLNSDKAVEVNIQIMRTFTKLRELMVAHKDLHQRINELERKYDHQLRIVFDTIRKLIEPPPTKKKLPIGFQMPYSEERSKQGVNERRHR